MSSVNKVIIIGHLGKAPEVRYAASGDAIANVAVATSETWKDKNGEKQERTEWHRVVFYRKLAEIVGEYLDKGSLVYIEGKLQTRKWQNKDGVDQYTTEIIADKMQMMGGKHQGESAPRQAQQQAPAQSAGAPAQRGNSFEDMDDDIPF